MGFLGTTIMLIATIALASHGLALVEVAAHEMIRAFFLELIAYASALMLSLMLFVTFVSSETFENVWSRIRTYGEALKLRVLEVYYFHKLRVRHKVVGKGG